MDRSADRCNSADHISQEFRTRQILGLACRNHFAVQARNQAGINVPDEVAWEWLSRNPAKALGILDKTGTLAAGKMADVVLWNGNPFSDYTRPERVWIDGALMFDANDPKRRPVSDFELGQPGEGDVK